MMTSLIRAQRNLVPKVLMMVALAAALLPGTVRAAEAPAEVSPQDLMTKVANDMLAALDKNRAEIRKDPAAVIPLVNQILLPHFDTEYAAQKVLAQHWREATPEQQKRFVNTFYNALLKTYSGALADFTADRLTILPFKGEPGAVNATVRTTVRRDNGQQVPVDYSLRRTPDGWKAWDVVIEGISYVRNYRNDLGAEIDQKGLEPVIARLEKDGLTTTRALGKKAG
jgi:phospholipid transport system substrate-binding protein